MAQLGDDALAAVSFCFPVVWLLGGIGIGYEAGAASCISRAVGARDSERARRLTTDTALLALLATAALCAIGLATIEPTFRLLGAAVIPSLSSLFSDSAPIQAVATTYFWLVPVSYGAYGLIMSINASFNGVGHPLPGVVISTLRVIVVFLPLAFLGRGLFGVAGIFVASALANGLVGALAYYWFGAHVRRALIRESQ